MMWAMVRAELIKQQKHYSFLLVLAFPLLQGLLHLGIFYINGPRFVDAGQDAWPGLIQSTWSFWCLLTWPLMTGVIARQILGTDHDNHHWTVFFSLGLARKQYLLCKWLIYLGCMLAALLLLSLVVLADGLLLSLIQPGLHFGQIPDVTTLLGMPLVVFAASLLMCTLYFCLALRITKAAVVFGGSIFFTLANLLFVYNKVLAPFYLWAHPALSTTWITGRNDLADFSPAMLLADLALCALLIFWSFRYVMRSTRLA